MEAQALATVPERVGGWSHLWRLLYSDVTDTAGLTKTLTYPTGLAVGDFVRGAAYYLPTAFVGTSITALKLDLGVSGSLTTLINNVEVLTATPAAAGIWNGASLAAGGYIATAATTLQARFTATGANLTAMTAGEVWLYLEIYKLSVRR